MRSKKPPERGDRHGVGQPIIKIIETNTLVRWETFDPRTREYEVKLPDGMVKIHESKVSKQFSIREEMDFLRNEYGQD